MLKKWIENYYREKARRMGDITVSKRGDKDYYAYFNGKANIGGSGSTMEEAIGKLVISVKDDIGISIFLRDF